MIFYNGVDSQPERQTLKLSEFLKKNRAEAIKVSIYEYDEELHYRTLLEEGREQGLKEGEILLARVNKLTSLLIDMGR